MAAEGDRNVYDDGVVERRRLARTARPAAAAIAPARRKSPVAIPISRACFKL